ncbi:MAG TPA: beta-galactosidase, partial [Armatimonadota bacterium]|nr:beta-galactosidase [Armatimonadota bacterium]
MQVGASYYPEVIPPSEWERDLATGREIGLSCLRCGEFAWSAFSPEENTWQQEWALEFLALAQQYGYEVIWCTPSATPPPYLFDRWPDLHAVSVDGDEMPVGVRRHYCPSHSGYQEQCTEVAGHLAQAFTGAPAIKGWQVDNEIAGDGFTCWCPRCQQAFQDWLHSHYGSLEQLNEAWQTGVWSQRYTDWRQIPIPHKRFPGHTPALKLDYRRFRSDNWLAFYRKQYDVLQSAGAQRVSTNFYNVTWDMPFNQWAWRPYLDAVGVSHYLEGEIESHFQLALLQGATPGEKPLWVLEQKAGQQIAQNYYPDDLARLEHHLRICAEHGAEYAIYWHL